MVRLGLLNAETNDSVELLENPALLFYEDEHLLIIDKPAGVLVHPTVKEDGSTIYNYVERYYKAKNIASTIHPVSRLDRNTSGLIIFAKTPEVQHLLSKQKITKEYLAIVQGTPNKNHDFINAPIARKPGSIVERCVDSSGKEALTEYEILSTFPTCTLVKVKLHTGRTHQIRVHFAYLGHPLYDDNLYGTPGPQSRHALHAYKLKFIHPITNKELEITSALPRDLQKIILDVN